MLQSQLFVDKNWTTLFGVFIFCVIVVIVVVVVLNIMPEMRMRWPALTEDNGKRDSERLSLFTHSKGGREEEEGKVEDEVFKN